MSLNNTQIDKLTCHLHENFKILEQEGIYCYERSHETWILKGDLTIYFFHKCANKFSIAFY
jgi:hypothetical protein